jgi:hypothetical protein
VDCTLDLDAAVRAMSLPRLMRGLSKGART